MTSLNIALAGDFTLDLVYDESSHAFIPEPGGSVLNTAVSLEMQGVSPVVYGVYGDDIAGKVIKRFLLEKRITSYNISPFTDYKSSISLAVVDEKGKPSYSFYRDERKIENVDLPDPPPCSLFHYGSSFAINDRSYFTLCNIRDRFIKQGSVITYDLNLRQPVTEVTRIRILSNIHYSDLIKGSDEDFVYLIGSSDITKIKSFMEDNEIMALIMTTGSSGAVAFYKGESIFVSQDEKLSGYSTIGAGDSFMSGCIVALAGFDFCISSMDVLRCIVENGNKAALSYIRRRPFRV